MSVHELDSLATIHCWNWWADQVKRDYADWIFISTKTFTAHLLLHINAYQLSFLHASSLGISALISATRRRCSFSGFMLSSCELQFYELLVLNTRIQLRLCLELNHIGSRLVTSALLHCCFMSVLRKVQRVLATGHKWDCLVGSFPGSLGIPCKIYGGFRYLKLNCPLKRWGESTELNVMSSIAI